AGTRVTLSILADETNGFDLLGLARTHVQRHVEHRARHLGVVILGVATPARDQALEAVTAAALAASATMPDYRSSKKASPGLTRLRLFDVKRRIDFSRTRAEAEGNNLARELTLLPPNELTPARYRKRV